MLARQPEAEKELYELYFPYRFQITAPEVQRLLAAGPEEFFRATTGLLYSPLSSFYTRYLGTDPLLLFPRRLQSLPLRIGRVELEDDVLAVRGEGRTYVLVVGTLAESAFGLTLQDQVLRLITAEEQQLAAVEPQARVLFSGLIRFAAASAKTLQYELNLIGYGSMLGLLLLLLLVFGSFREVLLALLAIVVGLFEALAATLAIFSELHLLALAFGISMIGISIDYSIHYFAARRFGAEPWEPFAARRRLLPALTLAFVTSLISFCGLAAAPFPGLQQLAVFSAVGLAGSFGTVLCWYPHLLRTPARGRPWLAAAWLVRVLNGWSRWAAWRGCRWVVCAAAVLALVGMTRLKANDDVRLLQAVPTELVQNERRIEELLGTAERGRFVVVAAETPELVLERLEELDDMLLAAKKNSALKDYESLSAWLPSCRRQAENYFRWENVLLQDPKALRSYLDDVGFGAAVGQDLERDFRAAAGRCLEITDWLRHPAAAALNYLWLGKVENRYAALVRLGGVEREEAVQQAAGSVAGAYYVNHVSAISAVLGRYRRLVTELLIGAYLLILALLIWRYGFRCGIMVFLPPLLAGIFALGLAGWLAGSVNLFQIVAVLIVLGAGIDYAIYFAEDRRDGATAISVLLCGLTTILSFGLLWLTTTPVLEAFGSTITIGITLALCPCAVGGMADKGGMGDLR